MLTATASPIDRVVGLELGADDYVAKPCELRELNGANPFGIASHRTGPAAGTATEASGAKAAKDAGAVLAPNGSTSRRRRCATKRANEHPLTASEFGLLKVFAANPKRVLSRERLLELANGADSEAFDRAVDLRIMRIRRKNRA